jgi:hypothetical protein
MRVSVATPTSSNVVSGLYQHLPDVFIEATQERARGDLVANLPLVEELGWEAKLRNPGSRLDHMICIKRRDGSLAGFQSWCDTPPGREKLNRHPEWQRLRSFLVELKDEQPPYVHLDNCWLEFDLSDRRTNQEVPSLFIGLEPPLSNKGTSADDLAAVMHAMGLVRGGPIPEPIRGTLATCWSELPDRAEIFQLGLMLPRDIDWFRLVVRGCRQDQMLEYLYGIGWHGHQPRFRALIAKLCSFATSVSLAINVGERLHPKVGFECHFGPIEPSVAPRWEAFFEFLVAQGLCHPSMWAALREWPGTCTIHTPPHADTGSPKTLAIKGFNHVKVSYGDGFPLEAKLYFGALLKRQHRETRVAGRDHFVRSWRKFHAVRELSEIPRPAVFTAFPLLNASLDHLLREWCNEFQDAVHIMTFPFVDGFRNESERQAGTVFPRALIVDALTDANELLHGLLDPLLAEEVDIVVASKRKEGWAYFCELTELPPDADTLAQVLQVLIRNGAWNAIEEHARSLVELAVRESSAVPGTVSTWLIPAAGRTEMQERQREYVRRAWGDTLDTEVIANFLYALSLLDPTRYRAFLAAGTSYVTDAMEPEGWWRSTWYQGPYYGTYVALRLLARMSQGAPGASLEFLLSAQRPSGAWGSEDADEVLSTALALLALLVARRASTARRSELDASVDRGVAWLTDRCRTPDDWGRDPFIRMDLKRASDLPAHFLTWGSATVTAAYVLKAMAASASRSHAAPA